MAFDPTNPSSNKSTKVYGKLTIKTTSPHVATYPNIGISDDDSFKIVTAVQGAITGSYTYNFSGVSQTWSKSSSGTASVTLNFYNKQNGSNITVDTFTRQTTITQRYITPKSISATYYGTFYYSGTGKGYVPVTKTGVGWTKSGTTTSYSAISRTLRDIPTGDEIPIEYRTGYTFAGWQYGTSIYNAGASFSVPKNSTSVYNFYAIYTPIKTNVVLAQNIYTRDGNAVTSRGVAAQRGAPTTITASYDSNLPALATYPSDNRYNFLYFLACRGIDNPNTNIIDWSEKYYPKDGSTEAIWKQYDTSITYYLIGIWEPKTFNLTANSNGGSGWGSVPAEWTVSDDTCSKPIKYNSTYGDLPEPTREGKIFDGWWTSATGGTQVTSGTIFTTVGDTVIYAHWLDGTIVELDPNGGIWPDTGDNNIKEITLLYNALNNGKNIINPIPIKEGYILVGFYAPDNTCIYNWDSYVSAKWTPSQSGTITYWDQDGKWKYYNSTRLTLTALWEKATDYTFLEDGPHGIKTHWAYTVNGWKRITKIFGYNSSWKTIK